MVVRAGVRDAASFWLQGYGGNASPFPYNCSYPPGYSQFPPSLLRVERTPKLLNSVKLRAGRPQLIEELRAALHLRHRLSSPAAANGER